MGNALLFTGKRITRRMDGVRGCLYESNEGVGYVRRAGIEWVGRNNDLPLLVRPLAVEKSLLVQVTVGYPTDIVSKVKIKFWAGVVTNGTIVQNASGSEMLVQLPHDTYVDVFTEDGYVRRVECEDGVPKVRQLTLEEQGQRRIEQILKLVDSNGLAGTEAVRLSDALYHQLVSMLEIKSVQSSTVFQQVIDVLEQTATARKLNKGVRMHLLEALSDFPLEHDYFRDNYCTDLSNVGGTQMQFGKQVTKGAPSERKAQVAARRLKDQERGRTTKGPSGGGGKKQTPKK
ncbi:MAG: hypothetical protein AB202_00005 [Parcubacteria bacterium C7867-007]|nr:MAG: hypothetical protein AB202_00005 [Parcubacteria bacterium C7867-007]